MIAIEIDKPYGYRLEKLSISLKPISGRDNDRAHQRP